MDRMPNHPPSGARALVARLLGSLWGCVGLALLLLTTNASTPASSSVCRDVPDSCPALEPASAPEPEPEDDDGTSEAPAPASAEFGDVVVLTPSSVLVDLRRRFVSTGLGRGPPSHRC